MRWRNYDRPRRGSGLAVALGTAALLVAVAFVMQRLGVNMVSHEGRGLAIDGDSLKLNNVELRLKGIDAPEYRQICKDARGQDYACGRLARQALSELLREREVRCAETGKDRYGRGLAICRSGDTDQDIAAEMVRRGMAVAFGDFDALESQAKAAGLGLWAGSFQRPSEWRRDHPREATVPAR
jgi:endonuclease YncB( thermonuclease family)